MNEFLIIHTICGDRNEYVVQTEQDFKGLVGLITEKERDLQDNLICFKTNDGKEIAIRPRNIESVQKMPPLYSLCTEKPLNITVKGTEKFIKYFKEALESNFKG